MNKIKEAGFGIFALLILFILVAGLTSAAWYAYTSGKMAGVVIGPFTIPAGMATSATLTGTVTLSPSTPVCIVGRSCSAPLANHTIEAKNDSGTAVDTTKTDDSGMYTLHLAPGHYTLVLIPTVGIGTQNDVSVTVAEGMNHQDLTVDSGLR